MGALTLPPPIAMPASNYGVIVPQVFVVHVAEFPISDGLGIANYCKSNPNGYRWHRSLGSQGQRYIHMPWNRKGAHDAGINSISVGVEQPGYTNKTPFSQYPYQYEAMAAEAADFCKFIDRKPSRDFIIGHVEDGAYGGTSSHTNPGTTWDWGYMMERTWVHYEGKEEDLDTTQDGELDAIYNVFVNYGRRMGLSMPPSPDKTKDPAYKGVFAKVGADLHDTLKAAAEA